MSCYAYTQHPPRSISIYKHNRLTRRYYPPIFRFSWLYQHTKSSILLLYSWLYYPHPRPEGHPPSSRLLFLCIPQDMNAGGSFLSCKTLSAALCLCTVSRPAGARTSSGSAALPSGFFFFFFCPFWLLLNYAVHVLSLTDPLPWPNHRQTSSTSSDDRSSIPHRSNGLVRHSGASTHDWWCHLRSVNLSSCM